MIYIMLGLLIMLLASFFIYKMRTGDRHAHAAVKAGGIFTALLLMLRLAPNMLANLLLFGPAIIHMLHPRAKADISSSVAGGAPMTVEEARQILEVNSTASKEEISAAFKKMMLKNHPDQGGSRYIAEQLIRAKEILLNQTK